MLSPKQHDDIHSSPKRPGDIHSSHKQPEDIRSGEEQHGQNRTGNVEFGTLALDENINSEAVDERVNSGPVDEIVNSGTMEEKVNSGPPVVSQGRNLREIKKLMTTSRARSFSLPSPGNSPKLQRRVYKSRFGGDKVTIDARQRLISDMIDGSKSLEKSLDGEDKDH